jgi:hypothetical protein
VQQTLEDLHPSMGEDFPPGLATNSTIRHLIRSNLKSATLILLEIGNHPGSLTRGAVQDSVFIEVPEG